MSPPLTPLVLAVIERDFPAADADLIGAILLDGCGDDLPLVPGPDEIERIRLAVLKLAEGDVHVLPDHIGMARVAWGDVVAAAGFAHDIGAHLAWAAEEAKPNPNGKTGSGR